MRARFSFEQEEESEEAQSTTPRRGGQRFRNLELNASKSVFRTVVSQETMPQADLVRTVEEEKVPVNHTVSLAFAEERTPPGTRRSILLVNDQPAEMELLSTLLRLRFGLDPICCYSIGEATNCLIEFWMALDRAGGRGVLLILIDEDVRPGRCTEAVASLREKACNLQHGMLRLRIYACMSNIGEDI